MTEKEIASKARAALEAWLAGMLQGGHTATPEDMAATYRVALDHYRGTPCDH